MAEPLRSLVINTIITEDRVSATEAAYRPAIQRVAEQLARHNRQRPLAKRLQFAVNLTTLVLLVFLLYTVYLDIAVVGDYCATHQPHYTLDAIALVIGVLGIVLVLGFFWRGEKIGDGIARKSTHFTSRILAKQSFREIKTEYFPFTARYTLADRQITYQRVIGDTPNERIKTPWQRPIRGTHFFAHEHFIVFYLSSRRLYPDLLILVDTDNRDTLRDYLLELSLTEIILESPEQP